MYSFEPSEEQRMLIDAVERYAANDVREAAREAEESGEIPRALIEKGWEMGILQASVPEEYGGFGDHSAVTGVLAAEAMAWGDLAIALAVMAPSTYVMSILYGGTEAQKKELIPPVLEAEWKPYVAALTESRFDFHLGEMTTIAKKTDGGYSLTGEKVNVPFADQAESFLVFAACDGKTQAFIVPPDVEGLTVGERDKLLGIQALPTYTVSLEDVKVPTDARLGGEDGFDLASIVASAQATIAAMAIGMSKAALDYALPYAKEREVWGKPIAQRQSIAFMLAEMAIEIESNRLLAWEAAWMLDNEQDAVKAAYLALTGASDPAMSVTDRAVQVLGGHGYIREHPVELWMRNGRGISTFAGMAMV
ncbi:MAG TPA: acyl-CoA dehydrogenase family protein [Anaerolineales bacterium]|nr:acyl-CoA dehydrogenase family protein [Anaerolineales bacterium]